MPLFLGAQDPSSLTAFFLKSGTVPWNAPLPFPCSRCPVAAFRRTKGGESRPLASPATLCCRRARRLRAGIDIYTQCQSPVLKRWKRLFVLNLFHLSNTQNIFILNSSSTTSYSTRGFISVLTSSFNPGIWRITSRWAHLMVAAGRDFVCDLFQTSSLVWEKERPERRGWARGSDKGHGGSHPGT